ncbi:Rieske Fe-S protein [Chitinophaga skermanii]|uniref:Rieske Fe-S protein n=1 Tax=Chitinophaga skermanii TaxID=331697 RepID=A0A327QT68_9BACT|nr:Rieske 2Fe-2S domain-containing protein [Chitinophaga skermanii]RAJ06834.1 Rieske Fe-S protein [Chitinophaga skermanii]
MDRKDFLSGLGISLAAVCVGGLAACSKGGDDTPTPNPGNGNGNGNGNGGNNALLSIDLNTQLKNLGDFTIANGVILIRTGAGNTAADFSALSSRCTHEGCTVATFNNSTSLIECNAPCGHGSRYTATGSVAQGPATSSLSKKTITVANNTLSVS